MKKALLLHVCLFLSAISAHSQTMLSWANSYGSTSDDYIYSCIKDNEGNIYSAGYFYGTVDFDPGPGVYNLTASGSDAYLMKMDSSGSLVWAYKFGSTGTDQGISLAIDNNATLIMGGIFNGTVDFDPGVGTATRTSNGGDDFFILKLDTSGQFIWVKSIGGNLNDWINGLCVDPYGNVCVGGQFRSTNSVDFDPGTGTAISTTSGTWSGFVLKLDVDGNYIWHKKFAGSSNVIVWKTLSDSLKNVYIDGTFAGTADFSPDTTLTSAGGTDIFILKLDSAGEFSWINKISSTNNLDARGFELIKNQSLCLAGMFYGTVDFDPRSGVFNLTSAGNTDIFILNLDTAGNFTWAKKMGDIGADGAYNASINEGENILVAGFFSNSVNFDPGQSECTLTSTGLTDAFVSGTTNDGDFIWAKSFGGTGNDYASCVLDIDSVHPVVSGSFTGTADFNPGDGVYSKTSNGAGDIFIVMLEPCISSEHFDTITACDSYTWIDGMTYTYSISGLSQTLPGFASSGCDSIVHLNLTIHPSFFYPDNDTICAGSQLFWRGNLLSAGGLYYDSLTTIYGCDSVFELLLTVVQDQEVVYNESICSGDSLLWRGFYYHSAGSYTDSVTHANSCDTTYILNLTVNATYFTTDAAEICSGDSFIWHGISYTSAGVFYDSLITQSGCDSVFALDLIVHPAYFTLSEAEVCNGESYIWRGNSYNIAGTYYDSLFTQHGCDSVFALNLTVHPVYLITDTTEICEGNDYFWHGNIYASSGIYFDSLTTSFGCDSIHALDLIVHDLPVVSIANLSDYYCVYNPSVVISGTPSGGTFSGNGVSGNTFDPATAGLGTWPVVYSYTDGNGCSNSDTINVEVSTCDGIETVDLFEISLYPNPTSGKLVITLPDENGYSVSLTDALGKIILSELIDGQKSAYLDLGSFAPGVYVLKVENAEGFALKRVVVE